MAQDRALTYDSALNGPRSPSNAADTRAARPPFSGSAQPLPLRLRWPTAPAHDCETERESCTAASARPRRARACLTDSAQRHPAIVAVGTRLEREIEGRAGSQRTRLGTVGPPAVRSVLFGRTARRTYDGQGQKHPAPSPNSHGCDYG